MRTCNKVALGAVFLTLLAVGSVAVGADDAPPYPSATDAYHQGVKALKAGNAVAGVAALEYAASRGVLGAELKLARAYASGSDLPKNDVKAFSYFEQIADSQADISPSSPVAKYVAEAFVALGQYHLDGIPSKPLAANPSYAADLFRHAASYFGDAEAQYRLARLYMTGTGVEKNIGLAVNWLAIAAKKQHAASQATLGEILWRGQDVQQRRARGLALITLAHENSLADGAEPQWISALYQEALAGSDGSTRKEAEAMVVELGRGNGPSVGAAAKPADVVALPAPEDAVGPDLEASDTALGLMVPPPAPIGLPVGFGASSSQP